MATATARPKDVQLADWFDDLNRITNEARELTANSSPEQMQWRPAPGKWSLAECLEHLAITARRAMIYWIPTIAAARAAERTGPGPFSFGWLGDWFIRNVGPSPKRPIKSPSIFVPPATVDPARALADFIGSQAELAATIRSADGLDLGRVKTRSAVTPLLRFNLATWFASTVAHEHRHLDQMRRIRSDPRFPTA
jgi:DinB superfamily